MNAGQEWRHHCKKKELGLDVVIHSSSAVIVHSDHLFAPLNDIRSFFYFIWVIFLGGVQDVLYIYRGLGAQYGSRFTCLDQWRAWLNRSAQVFFLQLFLTKALKHSDNIFDASPQVVSVLVGPITVYKACYIFAKLKRNFSSRPALIYSFGKPWNVEMLLLSKNWTNFCYICYI